MKSTRNILVWLIPYLFSIYMYWFQAMPSVTMGRLVNVMHLNTAEIGYLSAAYFYLYLLLQIPSGLLVDTFKPKRILLICIGVFCLGELVFAYSDSFATAVVGRLLMGFASAPAVACAFWLASRFNPQKRYARVVGVMEGILMLAGGFGLVVVSHGVQWLGWFGMTGVFLGLGVLLWLGVAVFVYDDSTSSVQIQSIQFRTQLTRVLKNGQLWAIGLFAGSQYGLMGALALLWGVPYAKALYGVSTSGGAELVLSIYLGAAVGCVIYGGLNAVIQNTRALMVSVSVLTLGVFSVWAYGSLSEPLFGVFSFALGFCAAAYIISFIQLKQTTPIEYRGVAIGFVNVLACIIGAPILQVILGLSLHQRGGHEAIASFHHAFYWVYPCILLGLVAALFVKNK